MEKGHGNGGLGTTEISSKPLHDALLTGMSVSAMTRQPGTQTFLPEVAVQVCPGWSKQDLERLLQERLLMNAVIADGWMELEDTTPQGGYSGLEMTGMIKGFFWV